MLEPRGIERSGEGDSRAGAQSPQQDSLADTDLGPAASGQQDAQRGAAAPAARAAPRTTVRRARQAFTLFILHEPPEASLSQMTHDAFGRRPEACRSSTGWRSRSRPAGSRRAEAASYFSATLTQTPFFSS